MVFGPPPPSARYENDAAWRHVQQHCTDKRAFINALYHDGYNYVRNGGPHGYRDTGLGDGAGGCDKAFDERKNFRYTEHLYRRGTDENVTTLRFANTLRCQVELPAATNTLHGRTVARSSSAHTRRRRDNWSVPIKTTPTHQYEDPLLTLLRQSLRKKERMDSKRSSRRQSTTASPVPEKS